MNVDEAIKHLETSSAPGCDKCVQVVELLRELDADLTAFAGECKAWRGLDQAPPISFAKRKAEYGKVNTATAATDARPSCVARLEALSYSEPSPQEKAARDDADGAESHP